MKMLQRAVIAPPVEIIMDRASRWQVLGKRAPLAAGAEDIHDAIDDLTDVHRPLVAAPFGRRDFALDLRPFFVGQVACVARMATVITAAVFGRPRAAPRESVPPIESQSIRAGQAPLANRLWRLAFFPDRHLLC
jgi:hypothetical protein